MAGVAVAAVLLGWIIFHPRGHGELRHDDDRDLPYDRAERRSRAEWVSARSPFADHSLQAATAAAALVRALIDNGRGWTPETLALSRQAVADQETRLGPLHHELAPLLRGLGDAL